MDCSLPGSSVHGILQARKLEWVAMSSSRISFWPRDRTCISRVSCTAGGFFTTSTTWEAPEAVLPDSISFARLHRSCQSLLHILMQSDHLTWYKRESQQALSSVGKVIHNPHNCCGLALVLQKGGNFHTSFQAPNFYWLPVEIQRLHCQSTVQRAKNACALFWFFFFFSF